MASRQYHSSEYRLSQWQRQIRCHRLELTWHDEFVLSNSYLSDLCQRAFALSPERWILRHRLELAKHLLRSATELTLMDIAICCGFESAAYFSRSFRRYARCSPREWRQLQSTIRR